ncbi:MAG TPA: phosphate-starvation-inducible PsiE family protein [Methylomirabilota bacterium]|nr:phosphate-starvation-inducible PsiE family protein [Methylomirabilota bacterium]
MIARDGVVSYRDHRGGSMAEPAKGRKSAMDNVREVTARAFTRIEDLVYVGLSILLAGSAIVLLGTSVVDFVRHVVAGTLPGTVVELLDRILLILMIVEILYTVQVSFREHALVPEPFLIVGLIAVIRRLLVLSAESAKLLEQGQVAFRSAMVELALLTVTIVALVASLLMLRRRGAQAVAERS